MGEEEQVEQQEQPQTGTPPETGGEQDGGERTFTQEELDAVVRQRLERERSKYIDYDDLKAKASKWAEHEEAQKTELQKLQDKADKLEREKQASEAGYRDRLLRAEVRIQAAQMGFRNPDDAYRLADLQGLEIDDDGNAAGVKEALDKLVQDRPYLLDVDESGKPRPPITDGREGNPPSRDTIPDSVQAGVEAAQQYGYTVDPKKVAERAKLLGKRK